MLERLPQPAKVKPDINGTVEGIMKLSKLAHPKKAPVSIEDTPSGRFIAFRLVHSLKARTPILFMLSGISAFFKFGQNANA